MSVRILLEFLEVMFESLYYSVLTKTYTASVIINAGMFRSLVLMRRRCFDDETECGCLVSCTRMRVICGSVFASYVESSPTGAL